MADFWEDGIGNVELLPHYDTKTTAVVTTSTCYKGVPGPLSRPSLKSLTAYSQRDSDPWCPRWHVSETKCMQVRICMSLVKVTCGRNGNEKPEIEMVYFLVWSRPRTFNLKVSIARWLLNLYWGSSQNILFQFLVTFNVKCSDFTTLLFNSMIW